MGAYCLGYIRDLGSAISVSLISVFAVIIQNVSAVIGKYRIKQSADELMGTAFTADHRARQINKLLKIHTAFLSVPKSTEAYQRVPVPTDLILYNIGGS